MITKLDRTKAHSRCSTMQVHLLCTAVNKGWSVKNRPQDFLRSFMNILEYSSRIYIVNYSLGCPKTR